MCQGKCISWYIISFNAAFSSYFVFIHSLLSLSLSLPLPLCEKLNRLFSVCVWLCACQEFFRLRYFAFSHFINQNKRKISLIEMFSFSHMRLIRTIIVLCQSHTTAQHMPRHHRTHARSAFDFAGQMANFRLTTQKIGHEPTKRRTSAT